MDIVYTALPYILDVVTCLVVTAIGVAGTYLSLKAGQSKKFDTLAVAVDQVVLAAQITVRELQQTAVEKMKEKGGGKLTPENIKELKRELTVSAGKQLSAPVVMVLEAAKVDVNALILSAGEAMINEMKNG